MNVNRGLALPTPRVVPALDPGFRPAVLANRAFRAGAQRSPAPIDFALERGDGSVSRFQTIVARSDIPEAQGNFFYLERWLKFLLWSRGGCTLHLSAPEELGRQLQLHFRESA